MIRWTNRHRLACGLSVFTLLLPFNGAAAPTTQVALAEADALLKQMTPEAQLALVHADSKFTTAAIPRLGIAIRWLSDGPFGVREDVGPSSWSPAGHTDDCCTAMPSLPCLAAAFDTDLARQYCGDAPAAFFNPDRI